jgi:hypothetical protein
MFMALQGIAARFMMSTKSTAASNAALNPSGARR